MNINPSGSWDYNNSNHDESIYLDIGLCNYLVEFIKKNDIKTIIDFGCSTGYYLKYISEMTKNLELIGVEPHVSNSKNKKFENILEFDLSNYFNLNKNGSIICLEVIEHIPKNLESTVITNIVNHCDDYLFVSWARPGQGGRGHVNERNIEYVKKVFTKNGFEFLEIETIEARKSSTIPWIKTNFCIFKKIV